MIIFLIRFILKKYLFILVQNFLSTQCTQTHKAIVRKYWYLKATNIYKKNINLKKKPYIKWSKNTDKSSKAFVWRCQDKKYRNENFSRSLPFILVHFRTSNVVSLCSLWRRHNSNFVNMIYSIQNSNFVRVWNRVESTWLY